MKKDVGNLILLLHHHSIAGFAAADGCIVKMIYYYFLLLLLLPEKNDERMMMIGHYDAVEVAVHHFRVDLLESLDSIDFLDFHKQVSMKKMIQVLNDDIVVVVAVEDADADDETHQYIWCAGSDYQYPLLRCATVVLLLNFGILP